MAVENIIQEMGYFCKSCGKFFRALGTQHRDTVYDKDGWGIETAFTCPSCGQEYRYSSDEVTFENESDRKAMGLTPFEWPPKK